MTKPQLRQPAGVPDGGQYAPAYHSEAATELPEYTVDDEVTDLLQDGSWEYPPAYFTDSAVLIRFWQRVPVSDTVLERFSASYTAQQRIWAQSQVGVWDRANPRPAEKNGLGAKQAQLNLDAWARARAAEVARVSALKPATIPDGHIRLMARVAQMYRSITAFTNEDPVKKQQVMDYEVMAGPHPQGRLEDFCTKWLLDKMPSAAFKDPTRHMPEKLDEMVNEQRNSIARLEQLQSELARMSALQHMDPAQYAREAAKHGW